jgi:hypothetical protein
MSTNISEIMSDLRSGNATTELKIKALKLTHDAPVVLAVEVLGTLWSDPDEEVRKMTLEAVKDIPEENFANYILMEDVTSERMDQLAHVFSDKPSILEAIILNPVTGDSTIKYIAEFCDSNQIELILLDKPRLSNVSSIYDILLSNARLTTELKMQIDNEKSGGSSMPAQYQASSKSTPTLMLTGKVADGVDKEIKELENIENEDEKEKSAYQKILSMSVPEKIQFALKGPKEARAILVRDANRVVATSVMKSPKMNDSEVENIAKMRNVSEDILRYITLNRHWMRKGSIVESLTRNPKTPVPITMKLLPRLNKFALKAISKSRDVPEAVRKQAVRMSQEH